MVKQNGKQRISIDETLLSPSSNASNVLRHNTRTIVGTLKDYHNLLSKRTNEVSPKIFFAFFLRFPWGFPHSYVNSIFNLPTNLAPSLNIFLDRILQEKVQENALRNLQKHTQRNENEVFFYSSHDISSHARGKISWFKRP